MRVIVFPPCRPKTSRDKGGATAVSNEERSGQPPEAEKLAREAFEIETRTLGWQHPYTLDSEQQLGKALAHAHRYPDASKLFRDTIEKDSSGQGSPPVWYSFACVAVAANRPEDALKYLRQAVNRGYKDANTLLVDDDLKNLRPNPKFQQLVEDLQHSPDKGQRARTQ